jgi:dTMP kinase
MKRGAFIVVEGLDRSGKSTQAQRLKERLESENAQQGVKLIKFPDRTTPIGKMIDSYLRSQSDLDDRAIHLLFSANRWELASSIVNDLNKGTTLICDRYAFSGIAFSAAKSLPYEWCRAPDISLPAPDLVLFLDISPDVAQLRGGYGEERYEKKEVQMKVWSVFQRIEKEMEGRWRTVDASGDLGSVGDEIWKYVEEMKDGVDGEISKLWSSSSE